MAFGVLSDFMQRQGLCSHAVITVFLNPLSPNIEMPQIELYLKDLGSDRVLENW